MLIKGYIYIIVALSGTMLLIPPPIYAQNTSFATACSLAGNIQIVYPTNDWIVSDKQSADTNNEQLILYHTSGKAQIFINGFYIGQLIAVNPYITAHQAGNNLISYYETNRKDFQLLTEGDYYIQDRKFVNSNPAYGITYRYTDSNLGSVDGITLALRSGEFIYFLNLVSKPELTSELLSTFEQMIPTFYGSLFASDPGPIGC